MFEPAEIEPVALTQIIGNPALHPAPGMFVSPTNVTITIFVFNCQPVTELTSITLKTLNQCGSLNILHAFKDYTGDIVLMIK